MRVSGQKIKQHGDSDRATMACETVEDGESSSTSKDYSRRGQRE